MKKAKKSVKDIIVTFCVFLLITLSLMSMICYFSFDQNYREVKQSYYATLCDQVITDMETSIEYGKSLDNYYGIEDVFARTQMIFDGDDVEVGVADTNGRILYSTYSMQSALGEIVASQEAQQALTAEPTEQNYQIYADGDYEILMMPVMDQDKQVGSFLLGVPPSVYAEQRTTMFGEMAMAFAIALVVGLLALGCFFLVMHRRCVQFNEDYWHFLMFRVPSVILIIVIIVTGMSNYFLFKNSYESAIEADAASIVEYVGMTIQELSDKGVTYDAMIGLDDYLADKVQTMPVLEELSVTVESNGKSGAAEHLDTGVVSMNVAAGDQMLNIEAVISDDYVKASMQELFLMFLATFIFCIVIIFELTRLPAMWSQRKERYFGDDDNDTYEYLSSGIRIASFLRTLANYMYLPYSALLIKQWNQSVGDLGVGVTAALPLTLDSAAQMIGMMLYPIWIKQPNRRGRLFFLFSISLMLVVNVMCFLTNSALVIIIMRFLGGFAYSGIIHTLNMLVANGSHNEERRQINLAASNGGLIGGCMCGAGIGAIVASLAGYHFSYMVSAILFGLLGIFVLKMMPWTLLERNADKKKAIIQKVEEKASMLENIRAFMTPQILQYCILIIIPIGFGVIFPVTLIPSLVAEQGNNLLLSYCYIANGIAGFYIGPKLVRFLSGRIDVYVGLISCLLLGAVGVIAMGVPPFTLMVLVSSAILGIFDGYGSPLSIEGFLSLPVVCHRVSEVTALAIYETVSTVVGVIAPVVIELLVQMSLMLAIWSFGGAYVVFAILFACINGFMVIGRRRR